MIAVCVVIISLTALPAQAVPVSEPYLAQASVEDLQRHQQQLDQERSQLDQQQTRNKIQESLEREKLKGLQKTVKVTQSQLQATETQLKTAIQKLQGLETKLVSAEQSYRQKRFSTIARLQFLQRQKLDRGWAVLLQSHDLNEFLDRRFQLKRLYQSDRTRLAAFKTDTDRLDRQRDSVEQKKNEVGLLTQELLAQKADAEGQIAYQKTSIARLKSDRRAMEVAQSQLDQDSGTISLLIQRYAAQNRYNVAFRGTGQLILPCLGEITSSFGWRMHPVLGYERFHSGMDIGVDYGTIIQAADRGTVIFAGWYGGYGNAVIIDHGGTITTLYAHASELYVVEGQNIQRGQAIAAVGSTGLSTGPHLHFEVRQEGEPTDPAAFL
ncbi:peptidoglycan DD-metalloendopeptidase family protein [Phormidium sp. CLA17]|nr:peptidoglycan DD-metalloendopeptidase family protein [Leptolyngbya sp. Cla-17]